MLALPREFPSVAVPSCHVWQVATLKNVSLLRSRGVQVGAQTGHGLCYDRRSVPRILVIDDSELVLSVVQATLTRHGFEVDTLESPGEFEVSQELLQHKPDLILMDVEMPGIQGDRLVELLGEYGFLNSTRVMLFSERSPVELAYRAAICGADGYLPKTSDSGELVRCVTECLTARETPA